MKEELNKDIENLRRKNKTEILEIKSPFSQIRNRVEGHFSKLEQVLDRISGLKDKIDIREKTEELLDKQFKSSERNVQELMTPSKGQT
jgi:chromosome segregation ATPase